MAICQHHLYMAFMRVAHAGRPRVVQPCKLEAQLGLDQRRQSKIGDGSTVAKALPHRTAVADLRSRSQRAVQLIPDVKTVIGIFHMNCIGMFHMNRIGDLEEFLLHVPLSQLIFTKTSRPVSATVS